MYEFNNELVAKLRNVVSKLDDLVRSRSIYSGLVDDYREILRKLETLNAPHVYTRDAFNRYVSIYVKLSDVEKILSKSSNLTLEEIMSYLDELKTELNEYIVSVRKAYKREAFAFTSPIYVAIATYLVSAIVYYSVVGNPLMVYAEILLAILAIIALLIKRIGFEYSYTILALTAMAGIVATLYLGKRTFFDNYNVLLLIVILMFSIMNIQANRLIKSKTYKGKYRVLLKTLNN